MMVSKVLFSKATDDWTTPPELYRALDKEFEFTDDPCQIGATDGLIREWGWSVFINPPYSNIRAFIEKGVAELSNGTTQCLVYLVPARTDTRWFHDLVYGKAEIRFIKGRLKFGGAKNPAPFPSMIAIFKSHQPPQNEVEK